MYNTNCADGKNYGQNHDGDRHLLEQSRRLLAHKVSTLTYETFGDNKLGTVFMKYNHNITREADL